MNLPLQSFQSTISLDDLESIHRPIEQARGMPNPAYTDAAFFVFERDNIMAKNWTAIGFVDQFQTAMVRPVDFMGLPILISKTRQGEIKVFHNVCSHRGMKLVAEEKQTNGLIVCPYHSWTYSVAGELKATPNIGGIGIHTANGFNCDLHGLKEIRCHSWLGILFINLSGDAAAFESDAAIIIERSKNLMGESAEQLLRPASTHSGTSLVVECNWKLAVENYLEAYHLPTIHPLLNSYSPLSKHTSSIIDKNCSGQVTDSFIRKLDSDNALPQFPDWDQSRPGTGEYPVVYPNLMLGFQTDQFYALIVHPVSATRCREELMIFYVGDDANSEQFEAARKSNLAAWQDIFNEDVGPCERMQVGRSSPGYQGGAFSPAHDSCSHHFHRWIAGQYEAAYLNG